MADHGKQILDHEGAMTEVDAVISDMIDRHGMDPGAVLAGALATVIAQMVIVHGGDATREVVVHVLATMLDLEKQNPPRRA